MSPKFQSKFLNLPKTSQKLADSDYSKLQDVHSSKTLHSMTRIKSKDWLNLRKTDFVWFISGRVADKVESQSHSYHIATESCDFNLKKFWELEDIPLKSKLTTEEKFCGDSFNTTTKRDPEDGDSLFNCHSKKLEMSLGQAKRRFYSLEKRLASNPNTQQRYKDIKNFFI